MIFEIADLDPKSKVGQIWSQNCTVPDFYEIWQSQQIEHSNYEYINRNYSSYYSSILRMIIGYKIRLTVRTD